VQWVPVCLPWGWASTHVHPLVTLKLREALPDSPIRFHGSVLKQRGLLYFTRATRKSGRTWTEIDRSLWLSRALTLSYEARLKASLQMRKPASFCRPVIITVSILCHFHARLSLSRNFTRKPWNAPFTLAFISDRRGMWRSIADVFVRTLNASRLSAHLKSRPAVSDSICLVYVPCKCLVRLHISCPWCLIKHRDRQTYWRVEV
jgi:hypothetical protein